MTVSQFISQFGWLAIPLIGIILGWKPVTKMMGRTNLSFDQPALNAFLSSAHLALRIILSLVLGYVFFIIYIIKIIIARSKAKKAAASNNAAQTSSEGNTPEVDTTNI